MPFRAGRFDAIDRFYFGGLSMSRRDLIVDDASSMPRQQVTPMPRRLNAYRRKRGWRRSMAGHATLPTI